MLASVTAVVHDGTIAVRKGLSVSEFHDRYLAPRQPVVLSDATQDWPAVAAWTPELFSRRFGQRKINVAQGGKHYRTHLREFISYTEQASALHREGTVKPLYLRNAIVAQEFPELLPDFLVPAYFLPNWLEQWPLHAILPTAAKSSAELFFGPAGAAGPSLHRDKYMTHSWLAQIYGEKRFWMISPTQAPFVYQDPLHLDRSLVSNLLAPDLETYPLLARAAIQTVVLRPGETIFIPAGWWHTAQCLSTAISLSGNFVNRTNFADFRRTATPALFRARHHPQWLFYQTILTLHALLCRVRDIQSWPC